MQFSVLKLSYHTRTSAYHDQRDWRTLPVTLPRAGKEEASEVMTLEAGWNGLQNHHPDAKHRHPCNPHHYRLQYPLSITNPRSRARPDVSDPLIVIIHAPSFFCGASLNEFTIACGRHHDQQSRISCTSGQDLVRMQAWANASMSLCEVARTNPVDPQQRTQDSQTISASLPMPCLTPS